MLCPETSRRCCASAAGNLRLAPAQGWPRAQPTECGHQSSSADLDVLPEADPALGFSLGRARPFVNPGIASVAHAIDHHVIELHAMRTGTVLLGHRRLLEPFQAHRARREID